VLNLKPENDIMVLCLSCGEIQKNILEKSCSQLGIESTHVNIENDLSLQYYFLNSFDFDSVSKIIKDYVFKNGVDVVS
ncbi:8098_t:CDS:2, partial [Scutellospora calospora]